MKTCMVSGGTGQDGINLINYLVSTQPDILPICLVRRQAYHNNQRWRRLNNLEKEGKIKLEYFDLLDSVNIFSLVGKYKPDYFINLGAMSHVAISFPTPEATFQYNTLGVLRILEAIRQLSPHTRYYQASSSEMFGISPPPQNESTEMLPQSPYGISKLASYHLTRLYRNAYKLFACNGILFNHEGRLRSVNFVTRKVTLGIANIVKGNQEKIELGNMAASRDWGDSEDYVHAIWKIVNHDIADDFVVSTGDTHSIEEFVKDAFAFVGANWEDYVISTDKFKRPAEVPALQGDSTKVRRVLGWTPEFGYKEVIERMVTHDLKETAGTDLEGARKFFSGEGEKDE